MKCSYKMEVEHPDLVGPQYIGGCSGCPHQYLYANKPDWCKGYDFVRCKECWDREVEKMAGVINLVFVKHENSMSNYLYKLPSDASVRKGDRVLVLNARGETTGVCVCDCFSMQEDVVKILVKELAGGGKVAEVIALLEEKRFCNEGCVESE